MSQSRNSSFYSEALADYHEAEESFARAREAKEQEQRYLNGEITYRTWVDGMKRRAKGKGRKPRVSNRKGN